MTFTLTINCDNAAFVVEDEPARRLHLELARILRDTADGVPYMGQSCPVYDINGNRVGEARFSDEVGEG